MAALHRNHPVDWDAMKVRVELQAYLLQYSPDDIAVFDYEMPEGASVGDLIRRLHVPEDLASVIIVGDSNTTTAHVLTEGDRVTLVPPLAGGSVESIGGGHKLVRLATSVAWVVAMAMAAFILFIVLAGIVSCFALGFVSVSSQGAQSIDQEPVTLSQARQLIEDGRVSRIYIRANHGNVDGWCYFLLSDGDDAPCRWKVSGVDVHLWGETIPTGVPILSEDDQDSVGLTSDQLNELMANAGAFNKTAPDPIALFDQR
jgi:molybdopterin converting factor small subunit